jgi:uncharacterized protein
MLNSLSQQVKRRAGHLPSFKLTRLPVLLQAAGPRRTMKSSKFTEMQIAFILAPLMFLTSTVALSQQASSPGGWPRWLGVGPGVRGPGGPSAPGTPTTPTKPSLDESGFPPSPYEEVPVPPGAPPPAPPASPASGIGAGSVLAQRTVQSVSPSFNCSTARHPDEKLICQSTELSELDATMAESYNSVLSLLNDADRKEVRRSQGRWLKERRDCGDDFLCTKEAYSERIARLNSVLVKLKAKTSEIADQCWVSDPNPPLNVRATPNGSIVGSLSNDTRVVVLENSQSWVFVGRYEDRSPIGWVYREYINCRGTVESFSTAYACYVVHSFPEPKKQSEDPVIDTMVFIRDNGRGARNIEVHHELRSGAVHKRHEQYSDYRTQFKQAEGGGGSWTWTGVLATNRSLLMKGELILQPEGTESAIYTEQLTANGKLDFVSIWSCYEQRRS